MNSLRIFLFWINLMIFKDPYEFVNRIFLSLEYLFEI